MSTDSVAIQTIISSATNKGMFTMEYDYLSVKSLELLTLKLNSSIYSTIEDELSKIHHKMIHDSLGKGRGLQGLNSLVEITNQWWDKPLPQCVTKCNFTLYDLSIIVHKYSGTLPNISNIGHFTCQSKPTSNQADLIILFKQDGKRSEEITVPLHYILKALEERVTSPTTSYQVYEHAFFSKQDVKRAKKIKNQALFLQALKKNYKVYIGLTKRSWQVRYKEHLSNAKSGSNLCFHEKLRAPGSDCVRISHTILKAGLSAEIADVIEESEIARRSLNELYPLNGLNMIPGGRAGYEYLQNKNLCHSGSFSRKPRNISYSELTEELANSKKILKSYYNHNNKLVNFKDIELMRASIISYNQSLMAGNTPSDITFVEPIYDANLDSKMFNLEIEQVKQDIELTNKTRASSGLKLKYLGIYLWSMTPIEVLDTRCCTRSYLFYDRLYKKVNQSELNSIFCSRRECFERDSGQTLNPSSCTPSRIGVKPVNAISDSAIAAKIESESNGLFKLVVGTFKDVKKPFFIEVTWDRDPFKFIKVSNHDNYCKRGSYKKLSAKIKSGSPIDSRIKTYSELDESALQTTN